MKSVKTALVLHPATKQLLAVFTENPSHASLIIGPSGIGKFSVAKYVSETVLQLPSGSLDSYPHYKHITDTQGKAISIEAIRSLDSFLSLKVPGDQPLNRVVVIENAQLMTLEAQNALLKTLEEPPTGTILILTANNTQTLLPTILSRVQTVQVYPPAASSVKNYFSEKYPDNTSIDRVYSMAGGLPGLMDAILSDNSHPLLDAVENARHFIKSTPFERIAMADKLAKDRSSVENMLFLLQQMAQLSLLGATGTAAKQWQKVLEESYNAYTELEKNGQPKLVLTALALHI